MSRDQTPATSQCMIATIGIDTKMGIENWVGWIHKQTTKYVDRDCPI